MPERASTKNPVDMGATGFTHLSVESLVDMGRITLSSGEVDTLIFHGLGRAAMDPAERTPPWKKSMFRMEKDVLVGYSGLQAEFGRPVMIGSALSQWESPAVHDLHEAGIRVYHRLDEMALILSLMYGYWRRRQLTGC
jgi:hypothetical protein